MLRVEGDGSYSTDVVGEINYQRTIERAAGGRRRSSARHETTAVLVLEDDNPVDENAVRVDIDGGTVGYLKAEEAPDFRDWLDREHGRVRMVSCPALIVGGWDRGGGDVGYFGVKLDLPDFFAPPPPRRRQSRRPAPPRGRAPRRARPARGGSGWVVWLVVALAGLVAVPCGCMGFFYILGKAKQ